MNTLNYHLAGEELDKVVLELKKEYNLTPEQVSSLLITKASGICKALATNSIEARQEAKNK
jgi:hypothetical protein